MSGPEAPLDFAFLDAQTFGDVALAREVLELFADQAKRLVPTLSDLAHDGQTATAHLLKGSCQGIGAVAAAELLNRYGAAGADERRALYPQVSTAFTGLQAAIEAHFAQP